MFNLLDKIFAIFYLLALLVEPSSAEENQKPDSCASKELIFYNSAGNSVEKGVEIDEYRLSLSKYNTFTLKKADELVYSDCDLNHEDEGITGWNIFSIENKYALPKIGEDITGNGIPKLVIYYSYNAAWCCSGAVILELGKTFKKLAKIEAGTGSVQFEKIDGDKIPEVIIPDDNYYGWPGLRAAHVYPRPNIILAWNGSNYVVRPDLMRKQPQPMSELIQEAKLISSDESWGDEYVTDNIPVALIQKSLELMYSGNEGLGWEFARMAWPRKFPVDEAFFTEWRNKMAQNTVWQAVINNRVIPVTDIKASYDEINF